LSYQLRDGFTRSQRESQQLENANHIAQMAADIVAAYVSNNEVPRADLTKLIQEVYQALATATHAKATLATPLVEKRPAVNIKKTIHPDYLICLEDGKRFKSLKRHLRTAYKLTPEQYREKWGLAVDYPMVAPNYAKTRSNLAKSSGLGKKSSQKR
jgi:predicted transcriptional regulator